MTDQTAHGGTVVLGCPTVLIGLSGTAGNVLVGTAVCITAATGRGSGTGQQSYNNCGVESSRQIINQATGSKLTENGLLEDAINHGYADGTPGVSPSFPNGGTTTDLMKDMLAHHGVSSEIMPTTPDNLGLAMSRGQGAIVALDPAPLWGPPTQLGFGHEVTVTGVEYDDAGNRTAVIINDTGTGQCGQRVPPDQFDKAVAAFSNSKINITTNPLW